MKCGKCKSTTNVRKILSHYFGDNPVYINRCADCERKKWESFKEELDNIPDKTMSKI